MPFNMNIDTDNAAFHDPSEDEPESWAVYLLDLDVLVDGPFESEEEAEQALQSAIDNKDYADDDLEVREVPSQWAGDPAGPDPSETCRAEVARILRKVADRVESGYDTRSWRTILDENGQSCGQWRLQLDPIPG